MDMNTATLPKKGLKKYDYNIDMEKKDLMKLTKEQLIKLLLKQEKKKSEIIVVEPTPPPRTGKWENVKPKPVPRKSVKQMVKEYENIIQPPDGYKPIPKPRTDRPLQMRRPPKPTRRPPPIPKVKPAWEKNSSQPKITQLQKALKGSTKSFIVDIIDNENPLRQLNETNIFIKKHLIKELLLLKGFKYVETLKVTLQKKTRKWDNKKDSIF